MPVEFKDYYEILGVPRTATADDIKKLTKKRDDASQKLRDKITDLAQGEIAIVVHS